MNALTGKEKARYTKYSPRNNEEPNDCYNVTGSPTMQCPPVTYLYIHTHERARQRRTLVPAASWSVSHVPKCIKPRLTSIRNRVPRDKEPTPPLVGFNRFATVTSDYLNLVRSATPTWRSTAPPLFTHRGVMKRPPRTGPDGRTVRHRVGVAMMEKGRPLLLMIRPVAAASTLAPFDKRAGPRRNASHIRPTPRQT